MKNLILGALLIWSPAALGEDPQFTTLKKGDTAPFDGRLFNNAAVSKLIVEDRMKIEQCNIQIEYEIGKANAASKYEYDVLYAKSEAADQRLNDVLDIRDEEIKFLRKSYEPPKHQWWLAGGFIIGASSAIGIMYAISPGLR